MNRMQVLEEFYQWATYNLRCYSNNLSMTEPKAGYTKEWERELEKVNIIQEMIEEEKQKNISNQQEVADLQSVEDEKNEEFE